MKPDWDKLMAEFKDSTTLLVADVDCTAAGKTLCTEIGVRGYPSIKYGNPAELQDYKASRSFSELKKFAEGLGPQCSPGNLDLCTAEKKQEIIKLSAVSAEERAKMVTEKEAEIERLEKEHKAFVEDLQKKYNEAQTKKDDDLAALKKGGLGLLKAVHAFEQRPKKEL